MTRKDYKLLAAAFAATKPAPCTFGPDHTRASVEQWQKDVNEIAIALQSDNPNFDRVRFIKACGGKEE